MVERDSSTEPTGPSFLPADQQIPARPDATLADPERHEIEAGHAPYGVVPPGQAASTPTGSRRGQGITLLYRSPESNEYHRVVRTNLPEHPKALKILVLSLIGPLGLAVAILSGAPAERCRLFVGLTISLCSPIALKLGLRIKKELQLGAPYAWYGKLRAGYTLAWIGAIPSVLWSVLILLVSIMEATGDV